jgi:hypothetical protein
MNWFKTKRERLLEELITVYKKQIVDLQNPVPLNPSGQYINVPIPQPNDMVEYWRCLSQLTDNMYSLFYLTQLRRSVVDEFEYSGKELAEYHRGQLAAIGMIFKDSQNAKKQLLANIPMVPEKDSNNA